MSHAPLLVELFTEELPPKALQRLGSAFAQGIAAGLKDKGLLSDESAVTPFSTPRRLAVHITNVLDTAADQAFSEKLMPVKVGLDTEGQPTAALVKKLAAKGLDHLSASDLTQIDDGKQAYLVAQGIAPGARLAEIIGSVIELAIEQLPIPKVMRYQLADGKTSVNFVRPAHALIVLHGDTILPAHVLGLDAGRTTLGHRFLCTDPIEIARQTATRSSSQTRGMSPQASKVGAQSSTRNFKSKRKPLAPHWGMTPPLTRCLMKSLHWSKPPLSTWDSSRSAFWPCPQNA